MVVSGPAPVPSDPRVDPNALGDAESLFRLAMERSAIGMCLVAPDGTFIVVNPALCVMFERPDTELLRSTWQELTHPDDLGPDLALVQEVSDGRRDHYRLLKRFLRPNGSTIWGDLSVGVVRNDDGSPRFFVSQIVDLTELVLARDALAESELHYRLLAEHSSDVIVRTDASRVVVWVSPSARDTFGWEPSELVGRVIDEFVHPDDVDRERAGIEHPADFPGGIDAIRVRRADGRFAWVSGRTRPLGDLTGPSRGNVVALRDVTDRVVAQRAREALDARYRLLAENTTDIVCETDLDGTLRWVSPSAAVLGWEPADVVGRPATDLLDPADRDRAADRLARFLTGVDRDDSEMRVRTAGGDARWMALHGEPRYDDAGALSGVVIGMRDCQAEVVGRRALALQSAGHAILARAGSEEELLADMCQAAVDEAGYLLAWYARRVDDPGQAVDIVACSREHADYLDDIEVSWGDGPLGQGPTGRALRAGTTAIVADLAADKTFRPWAQAASRRGFRSSISIPVRVGGVLDGVISVFAPELRAFDEQAVAVLEDFAGQLGFGIARLRDTDALVESVRQSQLLGQVVEQAAEAIVITDPDARIVYANPAAQQSSGYTLAEMRGHNPRIFQSGLHHRGHYEALWSRLVGGQPWEGLMVNRHKNGDLYEESATIAPVHDADGSLIAYVAIKRDVTRERGLEADLSATRSQHQILVEVMDRLHVGESLEDTAAELCEAACLLEAIDGATVLLIEADDRLRTIAQATAGPAAFPVDEPLSVDPEGDWRAHLTRGSVWYVDLAEPGRPRTSELARRVRSLGITAAALVPLYWDEELSGIVALFSTAPDGAVRLDALRDVIDEVGAFATSLLGHALATRRDRVALRNRIRATIDETRFHVVYQPVVDLRTSETCGYEALTRFDNRVPPDRTIADAHSVGLGPELEIACARLALAHAPRLPPGAWVSINLSPTTILEGAADDLFVASDRQIVVEITEHAEIHDYPQLRRALAGLPHVWVSVDDAGAGYASLQHILELRPQIVKLDVALVRHIDTDPARQGLAAGLSHFATQTGTQLVAEGVETPEEAETLRRLGILRVQGFLYGVPAPLD